MNHVEALKVARDALESIEKFSGSHIDIRSAREALAATAVIEPVAASIDGPEFRDRIKAFETAAILCLDDPGGVNSAEFAQWVDQHCAAQVAQAESAARHEAQSADEWRARAMKAEEYITLKEAPFGPEWQIYRVGVADGKAQALAAKPDVNAKAAAAHSLMCAQPSPTVKRMTEEGSGGGMYSTGWTCGWNACIDAMERPALPEMTDAEITQMATECGYKALPTVRTAYEGFYLMRFARVLLAR